ncbi:PspC domain-containing protein [Sphaerisporangium perillae]|uniref:PspC domain-containing protein n=1 Tax=Sphaerisporangium perillae TaxID=2935860 RepID=UPI00201021BE|nr:PspC domain-containing protein [Sphaerisporangium perillae]
MNEMDLQGHPTKELRRTREGRIVAGVCSGAAEFIGIDANILRLALAVATFFGGLGVGIYAVAWLLIPEEGKAGSIVQDLINKQKSGNGSAWQQVSSYWQQPSQGDQRPYGAPQYGDQPSWQGPQTGQSSYNDAPADAGSTPGTGQSSYAAPAPQPQSPTSRPQPPVDEPPATA